MSIDNPETYDDCRAAAHYASRRGDWLAAHQLALQAAELAPDASERKHLAALAKDYRHAAKVAVQFNFDPRDYPYIQKVAP